MLPATLRSADRERAIAYRLEMLAPPMPGPSLRLPERRPALHLIDRPETRVEQSLEERPAKVMTALRALIPSPWLVFLDGIGDPTIHRRRTHGKRSPMHARPPAAWWMCSRGIDSICDSGVEW
jgi:hypothetical protein